MSRFSVLTRACTGEAGVGWLAMTPPLLSRWAEFVLASKRKNVKLSAACTAVEQEECDAT